MKRLFPILLLAAAALAQPVAPATQPQEDDEEIIYRPPAAASSNARMGGGSRSGTVVPTIAAIVPEHVGLSGSSKPVLYWFCAEATTLPREFSIVNSQTLDTVKRTAMEGPIEAGWQSIDLGELGVELEKDATYEWRIALIVSTTNRSDNAVAGGMVQHVLRPMPLIHEPPIRAAARRAAGGLWYDAVHILMGEIPNDPAAKKALAALLRQVKLDEAAKFAEQN